ncbi:MAG: alpha-L-fucosidase [Acidimicrobiaceae bacterium]|jgi:alpha-L-fucosidase
MERALPEWFDDAKFGIFVHWTAAAVPAFAPVGASEFDLTSPEGWAQAMGESPYVEWYQNSLAIEGSPVHSHHKATYGDLPYDAFVEEFLGGIRGWDPDVWADLFAASGARYVVLVTKHHDGVALWPSAHRNPFKARWQSERDVVGELAAAVRARGMRFGTYYSGGLDWTFGGLPMRDLKGLIAAIPQTPEYLAYVDAHWRELIERYEPCVLWNDIGYPAAADLPELFEHYYDRVPDGVVNNRFDIIRQTGGMIHADFITPEYSTDAAPGWKWESTRGIGSSFGYNREESPDSYLGVDELVRLVADVVARGGNLLLNVGPAGDGTIPLVQAERVLGLGWWLRTNGDAIYGSRPWHRTDGATADGLPVRYTVTGDALNAIVLGTPSGNTVVLPDVEVKDDATVELLGQGAPLVWRRASTGVEVELRGRPPTGPAITLRFASADRLSR